MTACRAITPELVHVYPTWGPEHLLVGMMCWCHPEPDELDAYVIVHRTPDEASH